MELFGSSLLYFYFNLDSGYVDISLRHFIIYSEIRLLLYISGFGDYRPSPDNLLTVLVVILGGIILSTMCMDVVGRMYLKEIHYLGRKLRSNNPFYLIREAKAKRRRQAMASLLAQLAKGMIFAHRRFEDPPRKKSRKEKRRGSKMCKFTNTVIN